MCKNSMRLSLLLSCAMAFSCKMERKDRTRSVRDRGWRQERERKKKGRRREAEHPVVSLHLSAFFSRAPILPRRSHDPLTGQSPASIPVGVAAAACRNHRTVAARCKGGR